MRHHAFTLIELLIVVAIIAILAAIAVPNFLEAQTRARVSRAQNDLRSMSLAMESYRVDNSTYIASYGDSPIQPHFTWRAGDHRLLTTPIAYLNSIPPDIFRHIAGVKDENYMLYTVAYRATGNDVTDSTVYPHTSWMTWSIGPDKLGNASGYCSEPKVIRNEGYAAPWIGVDQNGTPINPGTPASPYNGLRYDPTNGTVSYGDIYRFEGEAKTRRN